MSRLCFAAPHLIGCAIVVAALGSACSAPPPVSDEALLEEVQRFRQAKNEAFASGSGSPIPAERRDDLLPLAYYPPSLEYRVPAVLRPSADRQTIQMPTSTGQLRTMVRVGRLEFTLQGETRGLSAFVESGAQDFQRLFVPFTDATSGTETYPAGRYLDLDRTPTGLYVIDFNSAYNPYCYYDPRYDCPFPPSENRLEIPVRAGERTREAAGQVGEVERTGKGGRRFELIDRHQVWKFGSAKCRVAAGAARARRGRATLNFALRPLDVGASASTSFHFSTSFHVFHSEGSS